MRKKFALFFFKYIEMKKKIKKLFFVQSCVDGRLIYKEK